MRGTLCHALFELSRGGIRTETFLFDLVRKTIFHSPQWVFLKNNSMYGLLRGSLKCIAAAVLFFQEFPNACCQFQHEVFNSCES